MNDPGEQDALDTFGQMNPLIAFLDRMDRRPDVIARRRRSYELLGLRAGAKVVDVGCGTGTAVRDLASYVAPGGSAIGVDFGSPFIEAATARAAKAGVDVAFHVANAEELPFASESLDGYRAERLYQHLAEPTKALAEARRVLAPGGRIMLVDQDWDATLIDSDDKATTRAILRAFADGIVNGAVGRQYHRRLGDAGFSDVVIHAEAATSTNWEDYAFLVEMMARGCELRGEVNSALVQPWLEEQRERGRRGRFFMNMTHFLATARR